MKPNKPSSKPANPAPKPAASQPAREISQEQISERARKIWMERGQPDGKDMEHWLEAERQLRSGEQRSQPDVGLTDEDIESDKNVDGLVQRPR